MSFNRLREEFKLFQKLGHDSERTSTSGHPGEHLSPENRTFFQGFEWYCPPDGQHWRRLSAALPQLKSLGVDQVWLPPGCKAGWQGSNGYDVYDLYDLGEFDQKGHQSTKWGPKEELIDLAKEAHRFDVGLCWDAILNHKSGADYTEKCNAVKVDKEDRRKECSPVHEVEVWTGYDFSGRGDRYSSMKWHWHHFSGTDWEAKLQSNEHLYKFVGPNKPGWAQDVDKSYGNYDFLMGNNLDYSQREVRDEMHAWGEWIVKEVRLSGFRLDAVKHFSQGFLKEWIARLDAKFQKKLFFVGEYWYDDIRVLGPVIEKFEGRLSLFDTPLAGNMSKLSKEGSRGDLRQILNGTLAKHYPHQAVTFVLNHDTQERFERDHPVVPIQSWFIPLGYAFILLRAGSGYPCVFYGDLYGIAGENPQPPSCLGVLPRLMLARKLYAYGYMKDYFDRPECIGFTRLGDHRHSQGAGLAVLLCIGNLFSTKTMYVGQEHANEKWIDILHFAWGIVVIDEKGFGNFPVGPRSVGVWVNSKASERSQLDNFDLQML